MTDQFRIADERPIFNRHGILRRQFLTGSLAAGALTIAGSGSWAQNGATIPEVCVPPIPPGQPVTFTPATGVPVRVRKSAFELSTAEVDRLKKAYAALRDLAKTKPDDPRNWFHQGQVHCWYCSGAIDGLWGQEIHGGWWFLPWHRAYLFFHEQLLGALIGDPTFALPYWDWDTAGRDKFPFDTYGHPGDTTNPLYDPTRGVGPNDRIPAQFVGATAMKNVLNSKTFADFGGSSDQEIGMGRLEGGPHGAVHVWTTDPSVDFNNPKSDMGVLASAAFDPVFFAHHANIDRIWDKWITADPAHHTNPSNDVWQQQGFFFYDQSPTWTYISNSQMTSPELLSYKYQAPQSGPASAAVASAAVQGEPVRVAQRLNAPIVELQRNTEPKALTPEPTTVQTTIPAQSRQRLTAAIAPAAASTIILRVEGVEVPADRGALVNVFLNRPDATAAAGPDDPGFVGTIAIVASQAPGGGGHKHPVLRNFSFDVTGALAESLRNNNDNVAVTLVPATGTGKKPEAVNLRYSRVYLTTRE